MTKTVGFGSGDASTGDERIMQPVPTRKLDGKLSFNRN
jgi:hypothetical protein